MKTNSVSHILLNWLVNNKTGKLTKLSKMDYSLVGEGYIGSGKIWLLPTNNHIFLHCGVGIRTSPVKQINKVIQDGDTTTVIVETSTSIYEILIDRD